MAVKKLGFQIGRIFSKVHIVIGTNNILPKINLFLIIKEEI